MMRVLVSVVVVVFVVVSDSKWVTVLMLLLLLFWWPQLGVVAWEEDRHCVARWEWFVVWWPWIVSDRECVANSHSFSLLLM